MDSKRKCKFKVGDKVRVINYGAPMWSWDEIPGATLISKDEKGPYWYDLRPEVLGEIGIVHEAHLTQGIPQYALNGTTIYAWYGEQQLEEILPTSEDKRFRGYGTSKKKTDRAGR